MKFPYEDIVSLPHPVSRRHAPMRDADRAAQFSPFAALNGHAAAIAETARLTDCRAELAEDGAAALNEALCDLARRLDDRPEVTILYFVRDEKKPGGAYKAITGRLEKIDLYRQNLLVDGACISIGEIFEIQKTRS